MIPFTTTGTITTTNILAPILIALGTIEIVFYTIYILHLKPRANDLSRKTIKPFRDYDDMIHGNTQNHRRHLLFKRILDRIEERCRIENKDFKQELDTFLRRWFNEKKKKNDHAPSEEEANDNANANANDSPSNANANASVNNECISVSSNSSSNSDLSQARSEMESSMNTTSTTPTTTTIQCNHDFSSALDQEGLKEFFAWAFFDKFYKHAEEWEENEICIMMNMLQDKYNIVFPIRRSHDNMERVKPRCMTLEDGNPLHRPLLLYLAFWFLRQMGYVILYFLGYRRFFVVCKSGNQLRYWYQSGSGNGKADSGAGDPILFFHGIAPGGLTFYLPMVRNCLTGQQKKTQQPIFLFENLAITCHLSFEALTEEETVHGVEQALRTHGFHEKKTKLTLCGHSFGSFQLTWLLKAQNLRPMIHRFILLDPVSILLSEPDVVLNFLYNGGKEEVNDLKIRLVASSELFIEHYLRRHFAWYNSELWIEDIPEHMHVHVFISEKDRIIDAEKVKKELDRHRRKTIQYTFWEGTVHGDCITSPKLWGEVAEIFKPRYKLD